MVKNGGYLPGKRRKSWIARKEYIDWIESARKPETRSSRVEQAIPLILAGKRLNS